MRPKVASDPVKGWDLKYATRKNLGFPTKLIFKNNIYIKQYKYYTLIIINNVLR